MYRAEIEPMPENPPDRLPYTGLWRVMIYQGERFVRSDKEHITYAMAKKIAKEFNFQFGYKEKAKGA